jgi:hypothetical protein
MLKAGLFAPAPEGFFPGLWNDAENDLPADADSGW